MFRIAELCLIELGVEIILALLPGEFAAAFESMLGCTQNDGILGHKFLCERYRLITQLVERHGAVHKAHVGGLLSRESIARHNVFEGFAMTDGISEGLAHQVAGRYAPVNLGKAEDCCLRGDGEIARNQWRKPTSEAPPIDHGYSWLGVHTKQLPLPSGSLAANAFLDDLRCLIDFAKVLLEVHTGGPGFTCASQDEDFRRVLEFQRLKNLTHLPIQSRAHGVALFRTIEDHPRDAIFQFDADCSPALFVLCHLLRSFLGLSRLITREEVPHSFLQVTLRLPLSASHSGALD